MAEKVMHGPMWQFECKTCGYMGDCWDIEREAAEEMQDHKCVDRLPSWAREEMERLRAAGDVLAHLMPSCFSVPCRPPQGTPLDEWCSECAALVAWQEARRG